MCNKRVSSRYWKPLPTELARNRLEPFKRKWRCAGRCLCGKYRPSSGAPRRRAPQARTPGADCGRTARSGYTYDRDLAACSRGRRRGPSQTKRRRGPSHRSPHRPTPQSSESTALSSCDCHDQGFRGSSGSGDEGPGGRGEAGSVLAGRSSRARTLAARVLAPLLQEGSQGRAASVRITAVPQALPAAEARS